MNVKATYQSVGFHGLIMLISVAFLHAGFEKFKLYTIISSLDSGMHFLGGLAIGFLGYALMVRIWTYAQKNPASAKTFHVWLSGLIITVIVWELIKWSALGYVASRPLLIDSLIDIIYGLIGSYGAWVWLQNFCIYYTYGKK